MILICIDAGTTNTRVWLTRDDEVLVHAQAGVGVRDTARDGSAVRLRAALRELIADVRKRAREAGTAGEPACIAAAGMVTSRLGLAEVPHVKAPAGVRELRAGVQRFHFADISDLAVLLVPGVRSASFESGLPGVLESDVMRGEETLCIGLSQLDLVPSRASVLTLGSHWKLIQTDQEGHIESSLTSLTGEMIHSTQTQTILASAVPSERPSAMDTQWCEAGMAEQRRSGLARALFCVRLLELDGKSTPEQRLSFLVGAFVASDLDALLRRGAIEAKAPVLLCGGGALAEAWRSALAAVSIQAVKLTQADAERALLKGLRTIVESNG